MSLPYDEIHCTGCDYEGGEAHKPIMLRYQLPDGTELEIGRDGGWCDNCATLRDIEPLFDAAAIKAELAALEPRTRTLSFRVGDWLRSAYGRPKSELREQLEKLIARLEVAEMRRSRPRCLTCGSEETRPVTFGANGLSVDFVHHCGGRLKYQHGNSEGIRFAFALQTILLDVEGRRLGAEES